MREGPSSVLVTKRDIDLARKKEKQIHQKDPKILIIPSMFLENQEKEDKWMLKSVLSFHPVWHSMSLYEVPEDPDLHDDTYKNIRKTREYIEKNLEYYEIISFCNIAGLIQKKDFRKINNIISEIKDDSTKEKEWFGSKYNIFETAMGSPNKKPLIPNCWIFLKEHFILFEDNPKNQNTIKQFFFGNQ